MNCVLFAKMDQVFSLKNKTLKNTGKMEKDTGKVREKSGNFVRSEKWEPCIIIWLCSAQGPREPHCPMCTCKMDVKSWQMGILLLISHDLNQQHPLNGLWTSCVMSDEQTLKTENDNICSSLNIYLFLDPKIRFIILFQKRYLGNLSKEKPV